MDPLPAELQAIPSKSEPLRLWCRAASFTVLIHVQTISILCTFDIVGNEGRRVRRKPIIDRVRHIEFVECDVAVQVHDVTAAKVLELQMLDAWVKVELQELMASIAIAVFCIVLIAAVNGASQFLVEPKGGTTDVIGAARSFMNGTVYGDGRLIYQKLGETYFNTARIASYSYTAGLTTSYASISVSSSPASGLSPLLAQIGQGMDAVANFMLLAASQSSFLRFFGTAAAVMLPLGIFLRSFSLTRKIGGVVLAAVIASAVIYPASFLVSGAIYNTYRGDMVAGARQISVADPGNAPAASVVCSPYMQIFVSGPVPFLGGETGWALPICLPLTAVGVPYNTCKEVVKYAFVIIKAGFPLILYPFLSNYGGGSAGTLMGNYYSNIEAYALPAVAKFAVLSLVVFLIPLIIAMVLLRSLAITFGGEPQLYGISKLV